LSEVVLHAIAERVRAHAGLQPPPWVLRARVRDRMLALGASGPSEYLARLGGGELDALVEALRVGETRFFRHQAHVATLRRVVVPALAEARASTRRVQAWSAGCASGEEAYTMAMLLVGGLPGWDVEVWATDLSEEAVAAARAAEYPESAVAQVPEPERARWFRAAGPGRLEVVPELRARVRVERRNLLEPFAGDRDLILCRNVLIYFDAEARAQTARRLARAVAPGGFLFLGYAETLRDEPDLKALRSEDGVVYQRAVPAPRANGSAPAPALAASAAPTASAAPAAPPEPAAPAPTAVLRLTGMHESAERLAADLRTAIAAARAALLVDLDGVDYLDDSVAPVLRRAEAAAASAGLRFTVAARRPGPRRWLERHGFLKPGGGA
jgi:chemotaxis protein methyltransferase CheR